MKCKKASLVINPRGGANIGKLPDVLTVFAAAEWSTDLALKEYGDQAMELAARAVEVGSDLVIAYGGDGTLNQVINGVMSAQGSRSSVGIIPGGTGNVWAAEMGIPADPTKAALLLVESDARKVDIGHVQVEGIAFPGESQEKQISNGKQKGQKKGKGISRAHFLLMAGLGIDAAIMEHVSKASKYQVGPLAVGVAAAEEIPKQRPFSVEIRTGNGGAVWRGEALQVVIGNTGRYAGLIDMTPDAYVDDGILDICVITSGTPLTTLEQIASLLWRRKPDNLTTEFFHGAHFSISVPTSVALQLDGSLVKIKEFLCKSDRQALRQAIAHTGTTEDGTVTYRFDTLPRALQMAIPPNYDDAVFKKSTPGDPQYERFVHASEEQQEDEQDQHNGKQSELDQQAALERIKGSLEQARIVKVVGTSRNPAKKDGYIVAGSAIKQATGEALPIAVSINKGGIVSKQTGEEVPSERVSKLQEGASIVVEGKKSKRGVLRARHIII